MSSLDPERRGWHLPVLMAIAIALYGGSRMSQTRDVEALLLAIALPILCTAVGAAPFRDASGPVRPLAFVVAGASLLVAELGLAGSLLGPESYGRYARTSGFGLLCVVLLVAAVVVEAVAARQALRSRFAAWQGIALGAALFLPTHLQTERFGSVFGAFFVGLFAGGGVGLLLGALLSKWAKRS